MLSGIAVCQTFAAMPSSLLSTVLCCSSFLCIGLVSVSITHGVFLFLFCARACLSDLVVQLQILKQAEAQMERSKRTHGGADKERVVGLRG